MKKPILFVMIMATTLTALGVAQDRQYEVPGVFSFSYGNGWTKGARKGAPPKELAIARLVGQHDQSRCKFSRGCNRV